MKKFLLSVLAAGATLAAMFAQASTTVTVGTTSDGNGTSPLTLRAAINDANSATPASLPYIILVPPGVYPLTLGELDLGPDVEGEPATNISILGMDPLANAVILQTDGTHRVFKLDPNEEGGATFAMVNLTMAGGNDSSDEQGGGGILVGTFGSGPSDSLFLTNCVITSNSVEGFGGGIGAAGANVTLVACTFLQNVETGSADMTGAGIAFVADNDGDTLNAIDCLFLQNTATAGGSQTAQGGGVSLNFGGAFPTAHITNCVFGGNTVSSVNLSVNQDLGGGGLFIDTASTVYLVGCTFTNNAASALAGGASGTGGNGGAILVAENGLTNVIQFCRFIGNTAAAAGGADIWGHSDGSSAINANDNWWGSDTGPIPGEVQNVTTLANWLFLTNTASASSIAFDGTATLTASFLTDSAGNSISSGNLTALTNVPVEFGAIDGSISEADAVIQSSGTATATFTGTTEGNGSGTATVDGVVSAAGITVQAASAVVSSVSSSPATNDYEAGQTLPITVTFDTAVTVTGTPLLSLNTGESASYATGSGTATLTFDYTVSPGDTSSRLDYSSANALTLNGGTIDSGANAVVLTLPIPGDAGSLSANSVIVIDTTAPTVSLTSAPASFSPTNSPTFSFTDSDTGSGVASVQYQVDGSALIDTTSPVHLSGLAAGSHTFALTVTDGAGNSDTASYTWTVDTTPPSIAIGEPSLLVTHTNAVSYSVTYADVNFASSALTTGDITVDSTGTAAASQVNVSGSGLSYTVTLAGISGSGSLRISITADTAVDLAGNSAPAAGPSFPVTVDLWQFDSLYSFTNGVDGNIPQGGLTLTGGNFYGVTLEGGLSGSGTIYSVDTNDLLTVLYTFTDSADGGTPLAGLVLASDGFLYGTTTVGGTNEGGTIFRISTNGNFQVVNDFATSGVNGWVPNAPLIQGSDGYLYGTTSQGGENFAGNIFRVSTNGVLTNLFSFTGGEGDAPMAPLYQASDGNFYGTASMGSTNNQGTIFQITPAGVFTELYAFSAALNLTNQDGAQPLGGLVQGRDGGLYGITSSGGPLNGGTVFRITTNGTFSVIHALDINLDGYDSAASLIVGSDGNLYGTTQFGSPAGNGSVFQVTTNGVFTTLYSFVGGNFGDGSTLTAPVLQAPNGNLYGTASQSGNGVPIGAGAIFELVNPNPPPLIIAQPTNLTVSVGGDATFIVSATSVSPLAYQWLFDGTNIDAATNAILTLTNVTLSQAGSYSVDVSNTNAAITSLAAILSVTQTEAIVTLNNLNQGYDGTARVVTATTEPAGLTVDLTYDGFSEAPTNAGFYTVIGTIDDLTYFGSATNMLVISDAMLVATANSTNRFFNQPNPVFTGALVGAVPSDNLSLSFTTTATPSSPPGSYDIVPVIADPDNKLGNYNVTLVDGALTVTLGEPVITLSTNSIFYTLNQDPVLLDPNALFSAPSSVSFDNGNVTVSMTTNAGPDDLLSFQNLPPGIASLSGAAPGDPTLTVTFSSIADASDIQELLRNLTFAIDMPNATNLTRALEITFDDGNGLTSAPVSLNIIINHRPQALPYRIATGTNLPVAISFARLLTNASDLDGDTVDIAAVDTNTLDGGMITTNQTGLVYTPATNFAGLDQFSYLISDGRTGTNTGIVYVSVLTGDMLAIEDSLHSATMLGDEATLGISGISGRTYRMEASADLILWDVIGNVTIPEDGFTNFFDTAVTNFPYRFYRTIYP